MLKNHGCKSIGGRLKNQLLGGEGARALVKVGRRIGANGSFNLPKGVVAVLRGLTARPVNPCRVAGQGNGSGGHLF